LSRHLCAYALSQTEVIRSEQKLFREIFLAG
jgi:hypothetical protein